MMSLPEETKNPRKENLDKKLLIENPKGKKRDLNFLKKLSRNSRMITKMKMETSQMELNQLLMKMVIQLMMMTMMASNLTKKSLTPNSTMKIHQLKFHQRLLMTLIMISTSRLKKTTMNDTSDYYILLLYKLYRQNYQNTATVLTKFFLTTKIVTYFDA